MRNNWLDCKYDINVKTVEIKLWIISPRIHLKGFTKFSVDDVWLVGLGLPLERWNKKSFRPPRTIEMLWCKRRTKCDVVSATPVTPTESCNLLTESLLLSLLAVDLYCFYPFYSLWSTNLSLSTLRIALRNPIRSLSWCHALPKSNTFFYFRA
jgi:hypothetical protein